MLFAKHGYSHARLDKQLQKKAIEKRYFALVKGDGFLEPQGEILHRLPVTKIQSLLDEWQKVVSMPILPIV